MQEDDRRPTGEEAPVRLRRTVEQLVRQQDQHLEWLRRIEAKLRAARESMLVYQSDGER